MDIFESVVRVAKQRFEKGENDYIKDGLIHCSKCDTKRQTIITIEGKKITVPCMCKCRSEEYERNEEEERQRQRKYTIDAMRTAGINDKSIRGITFNSSTEDNTEQIRRAKTYVEKWDEVKSKGYGIILWGGVGTGKTFIAACIANELIEKFIPVMFTSLSKIIHHVNSMGFDNRDDYINDLNNYDLLILDDFGVQRSTEYANEIVYEVIDNRYKLRKPLILTTNFSPEQLKEKSKYKIEEQRVIDRVLSMCKPIEVNGGSKRKELF